MQSFEISKIKVIGPNEFISLGIDSLERDKRQNAVSAHPELVQFGYFLKAERRLSPEYLIEMSSSNNRYGDYNLSIHESLSQREKFNDWNTLSEKEI